MAKSKGNFITLGQMFSGEHQLLDRAYNPMTVRFLMLQAHYGSPIDFSNEALQSAEVACAKLLKGLEFVNNLQNDKTSQIDNSLSKQLLEECQSCFDKMNDDFNTAETIACLFKLLSMAHKLEQTGSNISADVLGKLKNTYKGFLSDVLGILPEANSESRILPEVMDILSELRQEARAKKNFELSDYIRERLADLGIQINDSKDKTAYDFNFKRTTHSV